MFVYSLVCLAISSPDFLGLQPKGASLADKTALEGGSPPTTLRVKVLTSPLSAAVGAAGFAFGPINMN
jgi:hypothetical protein